MGNEPCLTWNVLIKYNFNNILKETRIKNNKKKKERKKSHDKESKNSRKFLRRRPCNVN